MNTLYPLKFRSNYKDRIWGGEKLKTFFGRNLPNSKIGESWELSAIKGSVSKVANGFLKGNSLQELIEIYMGDLVGDKIYEVFGIEFPLLIKFIDANDNLSVQVHPNDELAMKNHNAFGKTEMWYVIDAEPGAAIIAGFKEQLNKNTFRDIINLDDKTELLESFSCEFAYPGDVYFIPAGLIHAIGQGVLLAEIQQTSDITYRIYDYDRLDGKGKPRPLHIDYALEAIDFKVEENYKTQYVEKVNQLSKIVDCKYFTTSILNIDKNISRDYEFVDSFIVYICIDGIVDIEYDNAKTERMSKGDTYLIPAVLKNIQLKPLSKSKILEVFVK